LLRTSPTTAPQAAANRNSPGVGQGFLAARNRSLRTRYRRPRSLAARVGGEAGFGLGYNHIVEGSENGKEILMPVDFNELRSLPVEDKLRVIEILWESIDEDEQISLPPRIEAEAMRRLEETQTDPTICIDQDEMWRRIKDRIRSI
jgi:putative addiction module component (TIGR02574 family)